MWWTCRDMTDTAKKQMVFDHLFFIVYENRAAIRLFLGICAADLGRIWASAPANTNLLHC